MFLENHKYSRNKIDITKFSQVAHQCAIRLTTPAPIMMCPFRQHADFWSWSQISKCQFSNDKLFWNSKILFEKFEITNLNFKDPFETQNIYSRVQKRNAIDIFTIVLNLWQNNLCSLGISKCSTNMMGGGFLGRMVTIGMQVPCPIKTLGVKNYSFLSQITMHLR